MMKFKIYFLVLILFLGLQTFAQVEPFHSTYDWDAKPNYTIASTDSNDIIVYKEKIVHEFFFNDQDDLVEYVTEHQVLWLNSDKQIENNNNIYIPYSNSTELIINKARVITKDGKVIDLNDSKILTAEDEETKRIYKYFTFEGVEKGSFVEYFYVLKKYPEYKGKRLTFQTDFPKLNIEFDLFAPSNLVFEFKSYNGLDSIMADTNITDKLHWILRIDSIPALEDEEQSAYDANKQYLVYKLDKNIASSTYDISSYGKTAKNVYSFLYDDFTKSEMKALNKFIKSSGVDGVSGEANKIRALEDYIKKTIFLVEANNNGLNDISFILKNNIANETGMIKLYARLFKLLEIKNQLVITCDRIFMKFDDDFESGNFLVDYLFYFRNINSYLSATEINSRLGFPPPQLTNNYGLFIKEVSMGDFNTGIGKIRFIDPVKYDKTYDEILIDLSFSEGDITTTNIDIDRSTGGYNAMYIQPYMHLFDEKTKTELIDMHVKYLNEDIEIINKKIYNDNAESFGIEPFRVEAEVISDAFVEKAGNKYLFKVGELIGPQMEMYQDKKRILPAEAPFTRNYHREIVFTIPDGYSINNLNEINIYNDYKKDEEVIFEFSSSYTIEGNRITIVVDEFYKIIEVIPEIFEEYRAVINSAADFNKVTLILEPN